MNDDTKPCDEGHPTMAEEWEALWVLSGAVITFLNTKEMYESEAGRASLRKVYDLTAGALLARHKHAH